MSKYFIGIDNGITGSIGVMDENGQNVEFIKTPIKKCLEYTKTKQNVSRIDHHTLLKFLHEINEAEDCIAIIERPMVNPGRFKATKSAIRCLEATLICLEIECIPYIFVDSKQWQKELLPKGCKKDELKFASMDIGIRFFPQFKNLIEKQKDADGLLIAEWARKKI